MNTVSTHEAKTHLSRLLIVPVCGPRPERVLGIDRGRVIIRVIISDDFDAPCPMSCWPGSNAENPRRYGLLATLDDLRRDLQQTERREKRRRRIGSDE